MTHFAFLQHEWPDVFEAADKAEALVHADPRTACARPPVCRAPADVLPARVNQPVGQEATLEDCWRRRDPRSDHEGGNRAVQSLSPPSKALAVVANANKA